MKQQKKLKPRLSARLYLFINDILFIFFNFLDLDKPLVFYRLQEAKTINTSLAALGKVVMSLSLEGDRGHIPFRDSKLTRILKDSLNGSSYTTLLGNLNPTAGNCDECFNTLQFALRCSSISTVPQVNIVVSQCSWQHNLRA